MRNKKTLGVLMLIVTSLLATNLAFAAPSTSTTAPTGAGQTKVVKSAVVKKAVKKTVKKVKKVKKVVKTTKKVVKPVVKTTK